MAEHRYDGFLPGQWSIEAYGAGGFRFAEMSHRGSILALPSGIRALDVTQPEDLTIEALAALFEEPPSEIDMVLFGTGAIFVPLSAAVRTRLRAANLRADPMATGAAVSTYNILLGERRRVAAVLLATS